MNAIGSLTLRDPVFARLHSWTPVIHPDTMASKLTSYAMKYGYDETNADNTLAYYAGNHDAYIYRHLNDCMSDTVMITLKSWDSLCVCVIMMYDTLFMLSYEYIVCIHGIIHDDKHDADLNCLIQGME